MNGIQKQLKYMAVLAAAGCVVAGEASELDRRGISIERLHEISPSMEDVFVAKIDQEERSLA